MTEWLERWAVAALAVSNLLLLGALGGAVGVWGQTRRKLHRAARRLVRMARENAALGKALNASAAQYRALRRQPALTLRQPEGDDGESWSDDFHKTRVSHDSATRVVSPIRDINRRRDSE
jgi:hypothetical protein